MDTQKQDAQKHMYDIASSGTTFARAIPVAINIESMD